MINEAELKERADAALAGKSRSYIDDAMYFARAIEELFGERASLILENKTLNDNVTALQIAGTALVRENRRLRGVEE
jgi:hypothetical protein